MSSLKKDANLLIFKADFYMDNDIVIPNITKKILIFNLGIIFLFCYVFFSDFVYAIMHITFFKPITALLALMFMCLFIGLNFEKCRLKLFFFISLMMLFSYAFLFHNTSSLNYFYTIIFAFFLIQMPKNSIRALDYVFSIQFILLIVEFILKKNFYTSVTTGLFTIVEMEFDTELFEETGFRGKGLFAGVLIATCFVINYSLIHRNDYKRTLSAFIMSILVGGRLAIIITGIIFLYNQYCKSSHYNNKFNITKILSFSFFIFLIGFVFVYYSSSTSSKHFIDVFNMNSSSNSGRLLRYYLGFEAYLDYSTIKKLCGGTYELFDQYNRLVPTESEVLGILLEIGAIGFLLILGILIYAWKSGKSSFFKPNYVSYKVALLMSIIAILQYRHLVGNVRGLMFWFLIFNIICQNKLINNNEKNCHC